jgi:hypothetical protein
MEQSTESAGVELHPACALFPEMDLAELQALADDIKASGLREPILKLPNGQILDGWSRLKACEMAGVEPRFEYYDGDKTPAEVVYSANVAVATSRRSSALWLLRSCLIASTAEIVNQVALSAS